MAYLRFSTVLLCGLWFGAVGGGCAANAGGEPTGRRDAGGPGPGPGPGPAGGESGAQCGDGIDNDMDGLRDCAELACMGLPACAPGGDSGVPHMLTDGGFMGCSSEARMAMTGFAPVDIIWVIDNSGSMNQEQDLVQQNMNDFAAAIGASGINYRVVLINSGEVMVPPPLGTDMNRYLFHSDNVGSRDLFQSAIDSFPAIRSFLRPTAITHVVLVTDDEDDMNAGTFYNTFGSMLGHDFTVHSIASESEMCLFPPVCIGCVGPNGQAVRQGREYQAVSMSTGGQFFSICTADWRALFNSLLTSVAVPMPLPCAYTIPPPPMGMSFDATRVNVAYTAMGAPSAERFPYVANAAACPPAGNAWYYDNPMRPAQILLCPSACTTVSASTSGSVNIEYGCATVLF